MTAHNLRLARLLAAAAGVALLATGCGGVLSPRAALERRFEREGRVLLLPPHQVPDDAAARGLVFDRAVLATHEFYARRAAAPPGYLHIGADGAIVRDGQPVGTLQREGEWLVTRDEWALFADGRPVATDLQGWEVYWAATSEQAPATRSVVYPRLNLADSFMRDRLDDDHCRVTGGSWSLAQHGGGMARTRQEERDFDFQRAVNPFAVRGAQNGGLSYGDDATPWIHYQAEARFYFGIPKTSEVVNTSELPTGTDMLVAQGGPTQPQVGFGWLGNEGTFALVTRPPGGAWTVRERYAGQRPPLTNWVKLGLAVRAGCLAEAYLDEARVLTCRLDERVSGPFHLVCGRDLMEADDVRAWTLPAEAPRGTPVFAESRQFAGKNRKDRADPVQFEQWAESTAAFSRVRWTEPDNGPTRAVITTTLPLMGDFLYESAPYADGVGTLPTGAYEFAFYAQTDGGVPDPKKARPLGVIKAVRAEDGWSFAGPTPDGGTAEHREFMLTFRRRQEDGNTISVRLGSQWVAVTPALPGPCHVSIGRVAFDRSYLAYPHPRHHMLSCRNLVNDFFEEAPTDWSWIEGAFRMDCRWACQNQWSFMACGSTGVPYMTSKRTFAGDQVHEYYLSMRAMFPWDAGDADFRYDPDADRAGGFHQLVAHDAWYNRRDLNFSFCTNGRDPLSGYSVVFGGDDNRETRLLRRGRVVAHTDRPEFLFGTTAGREDVHWNWWRFTVRRQGNRVVVRMDDLPLFDYTDPDPLEGGHIGFWTVRNGFSLARVASLAERLGYAPDVLYVTAGEGVEWRPLLRDAVNLSRDPANGLTTVSHQVGAGFFGVRHVPPAAVDLNRTPVLELPFEPGPDTALNLHLYIGGRSYLLALSAPVTGMKALLTPQYEKGECFQIPTLSEGAVKSSRSLGTAEPQGGVVRVNLLERARELGVGIPDPRLQAMTIGNSSNTDYLLAGAGGRNAAGTRYRVGPPRFLAP